MSHFAILLSMALAITHATAKSTSKKTKKKKTKSSSRGDAGEIAGIVIGVVVLIIIICVVVYCLYRRKKSRAGKVESVEAAPAQRYVMNTSAPGASYAPPVAPSQGHSQQRA